LKDALERPLSGAAKSSTDTAKPKSSQAPPIETDEPPQRGAPKQADPLPASENDKSREANPAKSKKSVSGQAARNKQAADRKPNTRLALTPAESAKRYRDILQYARQVPRDAEASIAMLAAYLAQPARDEKEKAWAIYCWTTDHIAYNVDAFLNKRQIDCSAEAVLSSRQAICEGYANIFQELGQKAGLEVAKIRGHAKGLGYVRGEKVATNHTWNAIKVEGLWALVDTTWGAGYTNNANEFTKRFDDFFFCTPPEQFIYTHLPDDPQGQLLQQGVSTEDYQRWPRVDIALFKFGVHADQVWLRLQDRSFRDFVRAFDMGDPIRLHYAPLEKHLRAGQEYVFQIEAPNCSSMAVFNNGKSVYCVKEGAIFAARVRPLEGKMHVGGKFTSKDERYWTILDYAVE
jgi:transglutaminase/protease-like cytokinesis protein 3